MLRILKNYRKHLTCFAFTLFSLLLFSAPNVLADSWSVGLDTGGLSIDIGSGDSGAGGTNQMPGCGNDGCLTVPGQDAYGGIAVDVSLREAIIKWTNFFLGFLALIAMMALVFAGFLYVTAAGNSEQADKAKKIIIWVVIGIIVILIAYALVNTLITTGPKGDDQFYS